MTMTTSSDPPFAASRVITEFELDDTCNVSIKNFFMANKIIDSLHFENASPGRYEIAYFVPVTSESPYIINLKTPETKIAKTIEVSPEDKSNVLIDSVYAMITGDTELNIIDKEGVRRLNSSDRWDEGYYMALRILNLHSGIYFYRAKICASTYSDTIVIMK